MLGVEAPFRDGAAERASFRALFSGLLAARVRLALPRAAPALWAALGAALSYYPPYPRPRALLFIALALGGAALPPRLPPLKARRTSNALIALAFGLALGASARLAAAASAPPGELALHKASGLACVALSDSRRTSSGNRALAAGLHSLALEFPGTRVALSWPRRSPRLSLILDAGTDFHAGQRFAAAGLSVIDPRKALCFVPRSKLKVEASASPVRELRGLIRSALAARIKAVAGKAYPLAQALLLGVTDEIDGVESALFRASGCAHILSLSGQHLSVLCLLASLLFARGLRRPRLARAASLVLALFFTWLAGPNPSLLRSCLAVLLAAVLEAADRPQGGPAQLCTVFCLALALRPAEGTSLSFLLSYAAMFGLVLLSGRWADLLWRLPPPLAAALSPSLAAILATAPFSLGAFGAVALGGIIASTLSGPLVLLLMWSLLASLPLGLAPFLAPALRAWHEALHAALLAVLRLGAAFPALQPPPGPIRVLVQGSVVLAALFVYASPYAEHAAFAARRAGSGRRARREDHEHSLRLPLSPQRLS